MTHNSESIHSILTALYYQFLHLDTYIAMHWETLQKINGIFDDNLSKGWSVSKHDFYHKRNYYKRVGARIMSHKMKTMNISLFIEKCDTTPTDFTFLH